VLNDPDISYADDTTLEDTLPSGADHARISGIHVPEFPEAEFPEPTFPNRQAVTEAIAI
jgi:hypothetical protein